MKRLLSCLLALLLALTPCLAEQPAGQNPQTPDGGDAKVYTQDGHVTMIDGDCAEKPVKSAEDAAELVASLMDRLGGGEDTRFEPWRVLRDPFGNVYYVFQQTYADMIVQGGAVKLITDADGKMLGLNASIASELPDAEEAEALTAEQAEQLVLNHESMQGGENARIMTGMTRRLVLPVDRELDPEADELLSRFVWAVYTNNPAAGISKSTELPYLAHYVSMAGEYLYCLPTILPGDAAGRAGYDAEYVFQFMEPAEYTGYVDWSDGSEREISVTLMRDIRTGMYYLGNIEHKTVVADCWEFLYNGGRVTLEYSPDNQAWDQVGLLALYNYCRAYDYYREIGWEGGDGEGTPIIVLKDFCDENHTPVDNAAYVGKIYGWQCFLSSSANDYAQCLDICAHEYTHCVTDAVMTYNAYQNDYGAINEAISDIQGNLCEMQMGATEDTTWMVGENSVAPVRSMSDPHRFDQPEYSWDLYYQDKVGTPTGINDLGGVHTNSSLLSHLAYRLCADGGMTLAEARAYWFAVDCAMVPGTDFVQLRTLLPWVLRIAGLEAYEESLSRAIQATRLGESAMPDTVQDSRAMLVLELPDNEVFNNGNWALNVIGLNVDLIEERFKDIVGRIERGDTDGMPALLVRMLEGAENDKAQEAAPKKGFWELFLEELLSDEPEPEREATATELDEAEVAEAQDWLKGQLKDVYYSGIAAAGEDGRSIRIMTRPGRFIPILLYASVKEDSGELEQMKAVIYLNHHWVDVTGVLAPDGGKTPDGIEPAPGFVESGILFDLLDIVLSGNGWEGILDGLTVKVTGGTTIQLPADGLEKVTLCGNMAFAGEETLETNSRKSRPKATDVE